MKTHRFPIGAMLYSISFGATYGGGSGMRTRVSESFPFTEVQG
jgi:hypothetical protein